MSYGLFTVTRDDLADPVTLREKLALATGEDAAATRLVAEISRSAEANEMLATWHVLPDPGKDAPTRWRVEPVGGT
jgi:hypothetical protein